MNRSLARICFRWAGAFLVWPLLLALVGCGRGGGTVSGKVTFNGQPVPSGTVTFVSADGHAFPTIIQEDGSYVVEHVATGPATITVVTPPPPAPPPRSTPKGSPGAGSDTSAEAAGMKPQIKVVSVPAKYADPKTSGLSYTVTSGSQTYDIPLK